LLEENASEWEKPEVDLYMIQELVEGPTLDNFVKSHGPMAFEKACQTLAKLAATLGNAHDLGVIHRDIKPQNIVLEADNSLAPKLVDFGLSFNRLDSGDVTRVGEEVGNRFLRLPEQAFASRNSVSDLTQLAGVLLYLLTGEPPLVLRDDEGNAPHERESARDALRSVAAPHQFFELMSLFDHAFTVVAAERIGDWRELLSLIERVRSAQPPRPGSDELRQQIEAYRFSAAVVREEAVEERLRSVLAHIGRAVRVTADGFHLTVGQSDLHIDARAGAARNSMSILRRSGAGRFVRFRVRLVGHDQLSITADDEAIWRGRDPDDELDRRVSDAVSRAYWEFLNDGGE
jgi:serine/threonine-protein kinase